MDFIRISTQYIGMNEYSRLYRVDLLINNKSACYFSEQLSLTFLDPNKPGSTYVISERWRDEPRDEIEAQKIFMLLFLRT